MSEDRQKRTSPSAALGLLPPVFAVRVCCCSLCLSQATYKEVGLTGTGSTVCCHKLASKPSQPLRVVLMLCDLLVKIFLCAGENLHHLSSHHKGTDLNQNKPHGMCLTPSDLDRLRIFVHEFVVRALIPWVERQIKIFNEQVCNALVSSCYICINIDFSYFLKLT